MKTKKYKVSGIAFVPVEVIMDVEATTANGAVRRAKIQFEKSPRKYVVVGSPDLDHPFDWKPFAEEIK